TPLLGEHQALNAGVALATLQRARERLPRLNAMINDEALRAGMRLVNWPGRLEVVRRVPWLVLDAAHNGASAERLGAALKSMFAFERLILVFGAFSDKDVKGMFKALLPITSHLVLMQAINPRAFSTDQLAEMAQAAGYTGPLEMIPSAQEALARAEVLSGSRDLICITGSLSVVGEMRTLLGLTAGRAAYLDEAAVQELQSHA